MLCECVLPLPAEAFLSTVVFVKPGQTVHVIHDDRLFVQAVKMFFIIKF